MAEALEFIDADWPAPAWVRAGSTTRRGGTSRPPLDSLNLGANVEDDPAALAENRRRLRVGLRLPAEPYWLQQVHGADVVYAPDGGRRADGSWSDRPGVVCAVLSADCLPVLLCDRRGERIAALHAGWRGLAGGVIEAGVQALGVPGKELLAWLGPAIGADAFEVGSEVRERFVRADPDCEAAFRPSVRARRWMADLYWLARRRLGRLGVSRIYGGGFCTFHQPEQFYSYRRDGRCGRMASLIWRD